MRNMTSPEFQIKNLFKLPKASIEFSLIPLNIQDCEPPKPRPLLATNSSELFKLQAPYK